MSQCTWHIYERGLASYAGFKNITGALHWYARLCVCLQAITSLRPELALLLRYLTTSLVMLFCVCLHGKQVDGVLNFNHLAQSAFTCCVCSLHT